MDQDRARLPQLNNNSSPSSPSAAATSGISVTGPSSSSRSLHGSAMSSAFLGGQPSMSSARRFSPSLYPPPAAPSPSRLASHRGFAAASGSGSSASSLRSQQIPPPSPSQPCGQRTNSQPPPTFLSELISIRRTSANLFRDLMNDPLSGATLLHGQRQEQRVWSSSSSTMPPPRTTPMPSGSFSGGFPSSSQHQQASSSTSSLQPLPSSMFSGFAPPAMQYSSTMSESADLATGSGGGAMYGQGQPSSHSELAPLPPNLQISHFDLPPPLGPPAQNNGLPTVTTEPSSGFVQPSSDSEMHESSSLVPMPQNLLPSQEHVADAPAPCLEPETMSVDNDEDDLSAMLRSFVKPSHEPASLPWLEPATVDQDRVQPAGSGSGNTAACAAVEGSSKTSEAMPPPASMYHKVVDNGASSSGGGGSSIPWSTHSSAPMYTQQQQAPPPQHPGSSHGPSMWSGAAGINGQGWEGMPPMCGNFDMMTSSGGGMSSGQGCWPAMGSSSGSSSTGARLPCSYSSASSVGNSTPVPKLMLGGMERPRLPPRPLSLGAGCSSSLSQGRAQHGVFFSDAELDIIRKDNQLKDLVYTNPKRVKRLVKNRILMAYYKVQKEKYVKDLRHRIEALQTECTSLSTKILWHQELFSQLGTQNREMQVKLQGLNEVANLKEALNTQLRSELERLKLNELNMLNGIHNPPMASQMASQDRWSADGSNQLLVSSHMNDASGSHPLPTPEPAPQP